jgi:hypothetical protein
MLGTLVKHAESKMMGSLLGDVDSDRVPELRAREILHGFHRAPGTFDQV